MKRLEVTSENIAHADRYPDANGQVYQQKSLTVTEPNKAEKLRFGEHLSLRLQKSSGTHFSTPGNDRLLPEDKNAPAYEIQEDRSKKLVYEPDHPQADEQGYVRTSNVNLVEEMMNLMAASRVYEANVTVMNSAKQIAKKSFEL